MELERGTQPNGWLPGKDWKAMEFKIIPPAIVFYGYEAARVRMNPMGLRLLDLRLILCLGHGDFVPRRRAPDLPRRSGNDHVPIGTPSGAEA